MEDYIMNIQRSERVLETIPVGSLGIIALPSCKNLGKRVDDYLVQWRHESANQHKDNIVFQGYEQESYLLQRYPGLVPARQKELCRNLSVDVICT